MSDDTVSQPEDTVSRAEYATLQEQLKTARAERDRQIFEKSEIVTKANAYAKERDELKEQLASVLVERDRIIGDVVADHDKTIADITSQRDQLAKEKAAIAASLQDATRRADEAARRADEAAAEIQRLRAIVDAAPPRDLFPVLWAILSDKTAAAVGWVRSKIPPDSPILPYFDKTVAAVKTVGCIVVTLAADFIRWAAPKVIQLSKQGIAKIEEMLAKK